MEATQTQLISL